MGRLALGGREPQVLGSPGGLRARRPLGSPEGGPGGPRSPEPCGALGNLGTLGSPGGSKPWGALGSGEPWGLGALSLEGSGEP